MKILVLGTRGFPHVQGGVETHCQELYPRLVKLGCEVTVFTRTPYIKENERLSEWQGIKFIHLWCPRKKSLEAITHSLLGVLRAKQIAPDLLHLHAVGPSLVVPLARLLDIKTVMTHHGPDYERAKWGRLAKMVLRAGEKMGVKYSDRVISISRGIKEQVKEKFGKDATLIPNGVTPPSLIPPGPVLAEYNLEAKKYLFTACRFVPEKGLADLIEAYQKIDRPSFRLVIAGDADHETEYSSKIKSLAASTEGVVLTGFISGQRLGELFSNAGLFVLPSYYEGLPIALLEALSYGLPVLVSDIPQHLEVPLNEFRYFPLGDVDALSFALSDLFRQGVSPAEQEHNHSLLRDVYNWDKIAAKTLAVYKEVLSKG